MFASNASPGCCFFRVVEENGKVIDYPADDEGDVHCHGIVWAEGASYESFILPLYKFVRTFDHRNERGYYGRYIVCCCLAASCSVHAKAGGLLR